MLEPQGRALLFDVLKPPEGHTLDAAIGTTFTLDLLALLTAPVAFSLFDTDNHRDLLQQDSLTLLESLRRYADKLTIFCHAGRIGLPKGQFPQFEFLEKSVVQCLPHVRGASFHPKVWVLRFVTAEGGVTYRLACFTRNLTFDRCWDTALTMEGPLRDRQNGFAVNRPLADFIKALPRHAKRVDADIEQRTGLFESEIRRVQFELPEGFETYEFHPLGVEGGRGFPFDDREGDMLIVSPFVSENGIRRIARNRTKVWLVSRPESLETPDCNFEDVNRMYVLAKGTEDEHEEVSLERMTDLSRGLHAKCYVIDAGWKTHVFTGSANATEAAYNGNVEFLVELVGPKSKFGIDTLFRKDAKDKDATCLGDLLEEFKPEPKPRDEQEERIRALLDQTREELVAAGLEAMVIPNGNEFSVRIACANPIAIELDVNVLCWPVTVGKGHAVAIHNGDFEVTIPRLSLEGLSAFFAFEMNVGERSDVFVLNLPLHGAPADRRERLLRSFIKDRKRLVRFLFFLLADDAELADALGTSSHDGTGTSAGDAAQSNGALLESMLRTLHRSPERLDSIAKLVEDLKKQPDAKDLLPPGFDEIWTPIWQARMAGRQ